MDTTQYYCGECSIIQKCRRKVVGGNPRRRVRAFGWKSDGSNVRKEFNEIISTIPSSICTVQLFQTRRTPQSAPTTTTTAANMAGWIGYTLTAVHGIRRNGYNRCRDTAKVKEGRGKVYLRTKPFTLCDMPFFMFHIN